VQSFRNRSPSSSCLLPVVMESKPDAKDESASVSDERSVCSGWRQWDEEQRRIAEMEKEEESVEVLGLVVADKYRIEESIGSGSFGTVSRLPVYYFQPY
jgi:hypothetical protein